MKIRKFEIEEVDSLDVILKQDDDTILLSFDMLPIVIAELQRLYDERNGI